MDEQTLKCPKCGTKIPLTKALSQQTDQIKDELMKEFEKENIKNLQDLEKERSEIVKEKERLVKEKRNIEQEVEKKMKKELREVLS